MLTYLALVALAAPQGTAVPSVVLPVFGRLPTGEDIALAQYPTTNERGGFAVVVRFSGGDHAVWGSFDRTPPRVLLRDSDLPAGYRLDNVALGANSITYFGRTISGSFAACDRGIIGRDGAILRCLGRNMLGLPGSDLSVIRELAAPNTGGGRAVFQYSLPPATTQARVGIFVEGDPVPQLLDGDSIVGAAGAITNVLGLNLSPTGAHYGCRVVLDSGGGDHAVVDGAVLQNQGVNVQSGMPVDPSAPPGGPTWFRILEVARAANGDWWVHGADNPATPNRTFLMKTGELILERGDVVEGRTIAGLSGGLAITERGHAACLVTLEPGSFVNTAVWYEGRIALQPGQAVDTDGDGVAEPDRTITMVSGLPHVDADHVVWSQVQITDPVHPFVFVAVPMPFGDAVCRSEPNTTGSPATASAIGTQLIDEGDLTLITRGLPPNAVGLWLASRQAGFLPHPAGSDGNLCLGGAVGRFSGALGTATGAGEIRLAVDLASLPQPSGRESAQPGESWHFQLWYRDIDNQGGATSNFSSALAVHAR